MCPCLCVDSCGCLVVCVFACLIGGGSIRALWCVCQFVCVCVCVFVVATLSESIGACLVMYGACLVVCCLVVRWCGC